MICLNKRRLFLKFSFQMMTPKVEMWDVASLKGQKLFNGTNVEQKFDISTLNVKT